MSQPSRPKGVRSLADLHDRALAESDADAAAGAASFMKWFDEEGAGSSGEDEPAPNAAHGRIAVAEPAPGGRSRTAYWPLVSASAIAAAAGVWLAIGHLSRPPMPGAGPSERTEATAAGGANGGKVMDGPCANRTRAPGDHPLIDDFEDGNELVAPFEARNGYWILLTDADPIGVAPVLKPARRPDATAGNRFALHAVGGPLRTWGASLQADFGPSCYDVSAYSGLTFDARGPGRLYVGVREVGIVPVDYGGTCTHDCYDAHAKAVDLDDGWRTYTVSFGDLRQTGARAAPLNRAQGHSIELRIRPEDTPFDMWIDNVRFAR